jgi:hypothetical protein
VFLVVYTWIAISYISTKGETAARSSTPMILYVMFTLSTVMLLLNLVIAVFNDTYQVRRVSTA